jgi:predicted AlkP superfamily phosphohydrolase/phosphomutase
MFPRLRNSVEAFMETGKIDWSRTRAYANGQRAEIWINLKGRQSQGIVEPGAEHDELCAFIDEQLRSVRDPVTDEPYVECVSRREEVYSGPWVNRSPDLIVRFHRRGWIDNVKFGDRTAAEIKQAIKRQDPIVELGSGHHALQGVIFVRGKGIKPNSHTNQAHVYDVAPTLLYLMGVPIPSDMDGRVLTEIVQADFLAARPVEFVTTDTEVMAERHVFTQEDEEIIGERLRDLGYVE